MIVKHTLSADAGELSPWLDSRTDLAKYSAGFRTLRDFIVLPQGGVTKRPGMEKRGQLITSAATGRLIEFQISSNNAAILALGGGQMRLWINGDMLTVAGAPYTVAIPWADADLEKLRWRQINNVMYLVHLDYPMHRLTRIADNNWTLLPVDLGENAPFLKENTIPKWTIEPVFASNPINAWASGTVYVVGQQVNYASKTWRCLWPHTSRLTPTSWAPGATTATWEESVGFGTLVVKNPIWIESLTDTSSLVGQDMTLKASVDTWTADHVGSTWEIAKKRTSDTYEVLLPADNAAAISYSKTIIVKGGWTFETFGTWYGTFSIERSIDRGQTWETIREYKSTKDVTINSSTEGDEEVRALLRIKWVWTKNGSSSPYARLTAVDSKIRGTVRIKSFTNTKQVIATALSPVEPGVTYFWSEGAWSKVQGYPSCIDTHQARLVVAATKLRPHSIWGSAVDDYPNFYIGTDADMAYWHTIPVGERDPILWLVSEKALLVGTGSGEFVMTGENEDAAITPEFGTARRQSSYGSHEGGAAAIFSDSVALFVQRGGTRVREFSYRFEQDRYEASNLNILADHLFDGSPITDAAVQRMPFQVVWFVASGKLYGLTYERLQQVVAWHRHETQGTILSVATIRTAGNEDEVWFLVRRGGDILVERFHPGAISNPQDDGFWCDSSVQLALPTDFSGAAHLEGKAVYGSINGTFYGPAVLSAPAWPFQSGITLTGLANMPDENGLPISPNGFFPVVGERNGKRYYYKENRYSDQWSVVWITAPTPQWVIYLAGSAIFSSSQNVVTPNLVTTWTRINGAPPSPGGSPTFTTVSSPPVGAISVVVGLRYNAAYFPMKPEIPLANGSSRSREVKIHRIVPSVYKSRSGKFGETPDGELLPLNAGSAGVLFTGEIEKGFPGHFTDEGNFCIVSDEPVPFAIRSTAIKFNVLGDAS